MTDTSKSGSKRLIAIMGPTASGKTSLAIKLAKEFNTEIISVDSRQFYREITIGTAKPSEAQLSEAKHHFIDNLSIHDNYSAGHFARDANVLLENLFKTHDTVIAVGGSTLYFKAFLEGIDEFPDITDEARLKIKEIENEAGMPGLQAALKSTDPEYFAKVDIENPRRVIRALEVSYSGDKPYSWYLNHKKTNPCFDIIKIGLDIPRDLLYKNIEDRCDEMISNSLLEEVKQLLPFRHLKPLHTVGYTEFFEHFDNKFDLQTAITLFKQHTRNYAKRQMTWLRKEEGLRWIEPLSISDKELTISITHGSTPLL